MLENGTVCIKTCGRDGGKIAVVVNQIDDMYVLIDGQVRRKKCNKAHLEPIDKKIKIKPGASTDEVARELKEIGIDVKKKSGIKEKKEKASKEKKSIAKKGVKRSTKKVAKK